MQKKRLLLFIGFILGGLVVCAQHPSTDPNWRDVFQDDFTTFNAVLWMKGDNVAHGTGLYEEPQIYTSNNVYISNGQLVLRTQSQCRICPYGNSCRCILLRVNANN